jgi:hypothetical protein
MPFTVFSLPEHYVARSSGSCERAMANGNLGGVVRLLAATMVLLFAVLAILLVLDVVPREAFAEASGRLLAIGGIAAAAVVTVALLLRRG